MLHLHHHCQIHNMMKITICVVKRVTLLLIVIIDSQLNSSVIKGNNERSKFYSVLESVFKTVSLQPQSNHPGIGQEVHPGELQPQSQNLLSSPRSKMTTYVSIIILLLIRVKRQKYISDEYDVSTRQLRVLLNGVTCVGSDLSQIMPPKSEPTHVTHVHE